MLWDPNGKTARRQLEGMAKWQTCRLSGCVTLLGYYAAMPQIEVSRVDSFTRSVQICNVNFFVKTNTLLESWVLKPA